MKAPAGKPEFIHFDIQLGDIQRNPFRKLETTFPRRDEFLHIRNVTLVNGLHVQFDHVEITAPFYEQWPPKSHTAIFFDSKNRTDEAAYAREVLEQFMARAWGRAVTKSEVDRFMNLCGEYRPSSDPWRRRWWRCWRRCWRIRSSCTAQRDLVGAPVTNQRIRTGRSAGGFSMVKHTG